jgi:hypothetical protein
MLVECVYVHILCTEEQQQKTTVFGNNERKKRKDKIVFRYKTTGKNLISSSFKACERSPCGREK